MESVYCAVRIESLNNADTIRLQRVNGCVRCAQTTRGWARIRAATVRFDADGLETRAILPRSGDSKGGSSGCISVWTCQVSERAVRTQAATVTPCATSSLDAALRFPTGMDLLKVRCSAEYLNLTE